MWRLLFGHSYPYNKSVVLESDMSLGLRLYTWIMIKYESGRDNNLIQLIINRIKWNSSYIITINIPTGIIKNIT